MSKHYVYRHVRLDVNEPFYIGVGTKENRAFRKFEREYARAFVTKRRNAHWANITKNTTYEVDIVFESDNYEEVKQKEIEFIALYGRVDLKTGTLCNWTDGGDCKTPSARTRKLLSEKAKARPFNPEKIAKMIQCRQKPCFVFSLDGLLLYTCDSRTAASTLTGVNISSVSSSCKTGKAFNNYYFSDSTELKAGKTRFSIILQIQDGIVVKEWQRARDIQHALKVNPKSISAACLTGKLYHGYYWNYKNHK